MPTASVIDMFEVHEAALVNLLAQIVVENTLNHEHLRNVRGEVPRENARLFELATGGRTAEEDADACGA